MEDFMNNGYLKVCSATPTVKVANPIYNTEQILDMIEECHKEGNKVIVFPEFCITGYTCGDLFLQDVLLEEAMRQVGVLAEKTKSYDMVIVVGLPMMKQSRLYNVAAVIFEGKVLGFVPKTYIPNYSEFYEARHFSVGNETIDYVTVDFQEEPIPFGSKLLFECENRKDFILGVEICEDVWVTIPPSNYHARAGATVIANLSASDEVTGKDVYRKQLIGMQSAKLVCGYIYSTAGEGESTTDFVFSGHNLICENGMLLAEAERFKNGYISTEIDLEHLNNERRRMGTFLIDHHMRKDYHYVPFKFKNVANVELTRYVEKHPFVPNGKSERDKRCNDIFTIQAMGLKTRLLHAHCKSAVIGISGGLDSTLALLVVAKAFDMLDIPRENIICVTMPCFGTTDRTYDNAVNLTKLLGATLREIPIHDATTLHLESIGHDLVTHDVTFENAQARMRTLVLMNVANLTGSLVIGTGDLSELALGWATYNGDHMSSYGINSSVPKTLVRYLVEYYADTTDDRELGKVLHDVLDTPVSPELLPPKDGEIAQKTEDIVGPYELHDFFLYNILRLGYRPSKIFLLAKTAFKGQYDDAVILKWLRNFYRRFFSQQFKRSCLPDGPKVGSVAVSPRGDLKMPSDASVEIWMKELDELEAQYEF